MGVPIVKEHTVPVLITAALPADQGVCLFPLCRCHAVKGTVRLALYGRQSFIWVLSHVFPPFFCCRSPQKPFSCPIPAACSQQGPPQSPLDFVGRGGAAERVSFRHLAEANDTQLAATRQAPHSFGTSCPEVTSGQSVQKLARCGASPAGVFLFGRLFIFQGAAHR